jgi:hypothetical protein
MISIIFRKEITLHENNLHKESNNPIEFEGTVVINNVHCSLEIRKAHRRG